MFFPTFFWIKIGNIKDCSARKISGLDVMPGKHLGKKTLTKMLTNVKFPLLTLIFGKMTYFFSLKNKIKPFLITYMNNYSTRKQQ